MSGRLPGGHVRGGAQPALLSRPVDARPAAPVASRLDSLTGLRFFAAFVVLGYHLEGFFYYRSPISAANHAFVQGPTGVSFFFILSGFVLTWSHRPGDRPGAFLRRRLARIGPLHVLTWALAGLVLVWMVQRPHNGPALASLLLLSPWIPSYAAHLTMNTPSWSLGCELLFYACFPLLFRALAQTSVARRRLVGVTAVVVIAALPIVFASAPGTSVRWWLLYFFPPTRMLEFVIGIVLAFEVRAARLPRVPLVPAVVLAVGAYVADSWAPTSAMPVAVTVVPFALLIVAAAQSDVAARPSLLRRGPVVTLGAWSFALYLVHWPLLMVVSHLERGTLGATKTAVIGVAVAVLAVAASGVLHRFVERPLEARLRTGRPVRRFADTTTHPPLAAVDHVMGASADGALPTATPVPARPAHPSRLDSLTGLRFIAAFAVFGLHLTLVLPFAPYGVLKPFFSTGADGVSFFFILSGFVLTWSHRHGDTPLGFMRRRIARIYPTHVFTWVVTLVVLTTLFTAPPKLPALANLFLVSTWIPHAAYSQTMNTPSWSLCCELFFYACFPLILPRLLAMDSTQRRRTLVAIAAVIVVLAGVLNPVAYASHSFWLLYWFPPVRLLEFVAGMLLAMELAEGRLPRVPLWLAGAVAALAYVGSGHVPRAFAISSVTFVPFLLLIAAAAQRDVSGRRTLLATRPVVRLGTWSFAFYMVHYTVLRVLVLHMHLHPSTMASALFAVAALAISLTAAALTHRFVEQPWEQLLRSPLRRRLRSPA